MRRALLPCFILLAAAPSIAAPRDAFGSIDACVARLDAQLDIGYERIAARCPDLTRALEASGWSAWLPADWKQPGNELSAAGLTELRRLAARELAARPTRRAPRVARLGAVLAQLHQPQPATWRTRLTAWLRALLGDDEDISEPRGWGHVLGEAGVSAPLIDLLARWALAVILLLALLVVLRELRLAGVLRRPRRPPRPAPPAVPRPTWEDIARAPPGERPRLLLTVLTGLLAEQSRLPGARGLTARELTRAARLGDEADRERLREVVQVAEHLRFSDRELPPERIAAALQQGRELLAHLGHR